MVPYILFGAILSAPGPLIQAKIYCRIWAPIICNFNLTFLVNVFYIFSAGCLIASLSKSLLVRIDFAHGAAFCAPFNKLFIPTTKEDGCQWQTKWANCLVLTRAPRSSTRSSNLFCWRRANDLIKQNVHTCMSLTGAIFESDEICLLRTYIHTQQKQIDTKIDTFSINFSKTSFCLLCFRWATKRVYIFSELEMYTKFNTH